MANNKPRIIFFDIETAPIVATTWGLYNANLSHENILKDWFIICAAWKFSDETSVHAASIVKPEDDRSVVLKLRNALAKADLIVGHNSDKFDIKKLNARLIYHGFDPLPQIPTIDTLKEVKKIAKFSSNRLDYLAKILTGEGKIETQYHLWLKAMVGNKRAIADMVAYNKVDVLRLEAVYLKLRPYMKQHIHMGVLHGADRFMSCSKCGSVNLKRNGVRITAAGIKKQECQCNSCGSYMRIPFKEV